MRIGPFEKAINGVNYLELRFGQISDAINKGNLTLDEGAVVFTGYFLYSISNTCRSRLTCNLGLYEDLITDVVAQAIVLALKSKDSKMKCLSFQFKGKGISNQVKYIINESKIPGLKRSEHFGDRQLTTETCKDLAELILINQSLESLVIETQLTHENHLLILNAILKSNVTSFEYFDYRGIIDYTLLGDSFRKSKLTTLGVSISAQQWPAFAKILPDTNIKTLKTLDFVFGFEGVIEAFRNLRSLYLLTFEGLNHYALFALLPFLNLTHFEHEDGLGEKRRSDFDRLLADSVSRSSIMELNDLYFFDLTDTVIEERMQKIEYKLAFFIFLWVVPLNFENNGFNSLPRELFFKILIQAMQPINLEKAYCDRVETNVRRYTENHKFVHNANFGFDFFTKADAETKIRQQGQMISQLSDEKAALQRSHAEVSRDLDELRQTIFSLMPSLPQEALDKLRSTQAFAAPVEVLDEEAAEPELKKNKSDLGSGL